MVTLVGPGGVGKSRLAAEVGRTSLDLWPEGAWWVELAAVSDPRQVAEAVSSALERPGRGSAQDAVIAWLHDRRALLVLDNCEHLVAACAELSQEALERCANLTILATSREALGVPGEAKWPVLSLQASDAVPLFEVRAALVRPNFKITAANLQSVSDICERVDRLPLAIELAAARVGVLTEGEILNQLADRFQLLAGGTRTAPERQQTMRATIDWSYRLLSGDEALLFRRLSVFRGGSTLESVQAICGKDLATVLQLLAALVEKSLVVADRAEGTGTRYGLLESHLDYAADQLRESGELEIIQRRHYEYFRDRLTAATNPQQQQPGAFLPHRRWVARELGNLWAALGWARNGTEDMGLSLLVDLTLRDLTQERMLLKDLLAHSRAGGSLRVKALNNAAYLAWAQGDHEAALQAAESSVSLARELGEAELLAFSLNGLAMAHQGRGELAAAVELYEEASGILQSSKNRAWLTIRNSMGVVAVNRGDYVAASEILTEVVQAAKAQDDLWLYIGFLDSLAYAQLGLKDLKAAGASWKEALAIARDLADDLVVFTSLKGLAGVASARGDDGRALRLAAAADRLAGTQSLSADAWLSLQVEESQHLSRSRLGVRKSDEARHQGSAMTLDQAIDYALSDIEPPILGDADPLTRREREVVQLVAAGMTNRQIARRLFIAERSAEGHVERIRNKLGVRSRVEVATWAVEHGLIDAPIKERGARGGSLPS